MGKLTDAQKIEVIEKYIKGGVSQNALGAQYGIRGASVHSLLKSRGYKPRSSRKYALDETYFDIIGPNQAYFFGLLLADGYNCVERHEIHLELQERDKDILEKFATELKTDRPLMLRSEKTKHPNFQNRFRLNVNSAKLSNRLAELGMAQGKTFQICYPDWLDPSLDKHFIRGYVDGDGHVSSNTLNITGTEPLCRSVAAKYKARLGIPACIGPSRNSWATRVGGRLQVRKLSEWLYKDAPMYMERKYQKAMANIADCPYHRGRLEGKAYLAANITGEPNCEF